MRPERANSGGAIAQDEALVNQPVAGASNQAPAVMRRVRNPLTLRAVDPQEFEAPVPDTLGRPALGPDITTFERPWDKTASDYFTGEHALIRRPVRNRAGIHEPIGVPTPVVHRPNPLPWWCGTVQTGATPQSTDKGLPLPPGTVKNDQPADVRPDVMSRIGG